MEVAVLLFLADCGEALRYDWGNGNSRMDSLQGHFLIASPQLQDPNFFRSVVLLVQHNDQGALGVILNRPLDMTIQEAWPQVSEEPCNAEGPLHEGGPCRGPLMVLHTDEPLSQLKVCDGIYFNTDK